MLRPKLYMTLASAATLPHRMRTTSFGRGQTRKELFTERINQSFSYRHHFRPPVGHGWPSALFSNISYDIKPLFMHFDRCGAACFTWIRTGRGPGALPLDPCHNHPSTASFSPTLEPSCPSAYAHFQFSSVLFQFFFRFERAHCLSLLSGPARTESKTHSQLRRRPPLQTHRLAQ